MIGSCSFTDYVADRFDTKIYCAVDDFVREAEEDDYRPLELRTYKVHEIGSVELDDTKVINAYAYDMPDMMISFDIQVNADFIVNEGDHHYDSVEYPHQMFVLHGTGDLSKDLDDFSILSIEVYNSRKTNDKAMYDSLVPVIYSKDYEKNAEQFLRDVYPKALVNNTPPDPVEIARKLGLNIMTRSITEDCSVFGQLYFRESKAELYNRAMNMIETVHIPEKTILVDPDTFFLFNLGKINNTIIHECVHWYFHRKAFELDRLCNKETHMIGCKVIGGVSYMRSNNDIGKMEAQANALTPRIQMPLEPFKAAATRRQHEIMNATGKKEIIDIIEPLIEQLSIDYGVSKLAAKIRLKEAGYPEAVGAFNYVDGHYVRPYSFRSGRIQENQTFTISGEDAAIQRLMNPELKKLTENGDYLFVENHYVYNTNKYITYGADGKLELTDYARQHMDECCLIFDMKILSNVDKQYYTECYLNREQSTVTFKITFHNGYENAPPERQIAMRKKIAEEEHGIRMQMTDDPAQCMKLLLDWRNKTYVDLATDTGISERTLRRIADRQNTTVPTVVRVCIALHLPPIISEKLLDVLGCPLEITRNQEHMWINEALHVMYPESVDTVIKYLTGYGVKI